jgi:predicted porin
MKKSLIALAVLAAAGAAHAQSTVTLYGLADVWLGSTKSTVTSGGASTSVRSTNVDSGGFNTTRFGLKGSEDLGGGLKANFQLEQGFNIDTGTTAAGTAFNRQAWVGLSGGFGEVQVGRVWASYDDIRSSANDTFNANIASSFSTWVGYNDRTNNGIKYLTPSFGGISGSVTYALGEDKNTSTNDKSNDMLSVGVQYAGGPLFVGFAHQTEKSGFTTKLGALGGGSIATLLAAPTAFGFAPLAATANDGTKVTYNLLNGSYDLGVAKLVAGFNQVKATEPGFAGFVKANEFNFGAEVPLSSALSIAAGYSQSKIKDDAGPLMKSTGFSVAAKYSLSKRTFTYAALNQTKFKDNTGASSDSFKTQLFAVGVNHSF